MESRCPKDSKNVKTSQTFFEGFNSFFEEFSLTIRRQFADAVPSKIVRCHTKQDERNRRAKIASHVAVFGATQRHQK